MKRAAYIFSVFVRVFLKDKSNLFMIFFFNAFLMLFFGYSMQDKYHLNVDIGIFTKMSNDNSVRIINNLKAQPNTKITIYTNDSVLISRVQEGKLVAGIILAPNKVQVVGDPSRKIWLDFLQSSIELAVLKQYSEKTIPIEKRSMESRNLRLFDFLFPGILIFSIMQIGLSGGIMLLIQRKAGSLKRLQITPLKKWEFLMGYISCYLCIILIQTIGYILLAKAAFSYNFVQGFLDPIITIAVSSIMFVLLGIILCNFCNTVENGNNFNRFFIFPASFLCGVFIPVNTFPTLLQKISFVHPLTYLINIMRDVSNYQIGLTKYTNTLSVFMTIIIVEVVVAIYTFKWKEKT